MGSEMCIRDRLHALAATCEAAACAGAIHDGRLLSAACNAGETVAPENKSKAQTVKRAGRMEPRLSPISKACQHAVHPIGFKTVVSASTLASSTASVLAAPAHASDRP